MIHTETLIKNQINLSRHVLTYGIIVCTNVCISFELEKHQHVSLQNYYLQNGHFPIVYFSLQYVKKWKTFLSFNVLFSSFSPIPNKKHLFQLYYPQCIPKILLKTPSLILT